MKYIALLRGINVGGNNKVSMPQLKELFESLGFRNVTTYINSGNVIFDSDESSKTALVSMCETAIKQHFGFHIVCSVVSADELKHALDLAPDWWGGDNSSKHNAIFAIAPIKALEVAQSIGEIKLEYEKVKVVEPIIFWSAPITTFSRTKYSKIMSNEFYKSITIRNSNTTKKLLELCS